MTDWGAVAKINSNFDNESLDALIERKLDVENNSQFVADTSAILFEWDKTKSFKPKISGQLNLLLRAELHEDTNAIVRAGFSILKNNVEILNGDVSVSQNNPIGYNQLTLEVEAGAEYTYTVTDYSSKIENEHITARGRIVSTSLFAVE